MMVFLERLKSRLNLAVLLIDDLSPYKDKSAFGNLFLDAEKKKREIIRNSTGHFLLVDIPEGKQSITGGGYYYNKGSRIIEMKMGNLYVDSVLVDSKNPVTAITLNPRSNYPFPDGTTVIIGRIADVNYKPIPDALIEVKEIPSKSATSEADGGFCIIFSSADGGKNITLVVKKDGYKTFEKAFVLKKDTPSRIGTIILTTS
jgi:hypothetical protein